LNPLKLGKGKAKKKVEKGNDTFNPCGGRKKGKA